MPRAEKKYMYIREEWAFYNKKSSFDNMINVFDSNNTPRVAQFKSE